MATLVSPGVSVTVTNESFFLPTSAPTVPVFFIATRAGKMQPDGVTPAAGTLEHGVIETITSLSQSIQMYGVPYFRNDVSGNEYHGDARNEYGLLALNQFLTTGSVAYVIRANIDLNDDATAPFMSLGTPAEVPGSKVFMGLGNGALSSVTAVGSQVAPQIFTVTFSTPSSYSVIGSVIGYVGAGNVGAPFVSSQVGFTISNGSAAFTAGDAFTFALGYVPTPGVGNVGTGTMTYLHPDTLAVPEVWTIAFTSATAFTVAGTVSGASSAGVVNAAYDNNRLNFMLVPGTTPFQAGDQFTVTVSAVTVVDPLGANDAARRLAIVTALAAEINSNTDIRSVAYEFTLIAAPGYFEVVTELVALSIDVLEEAFVIADTPCYLTPEQTATWSLTSARVSNTNVAYYYPWCLTSNLDGRNVLGAPSGTALNTIAYSDNMGYVWEAPAGANRGVVTGVSQVGYATGTLGTATKFVQANLNNGQRDILYQYDNNINPIVFFPGRGILIWGQKTSAPVASALDRINVVRLVMYLRRTLRKGAFPFVFEPNDAITQGNLKASADGMLGDVLSKRGLYDYATICNASNNTPTRVDNGQLWLDVAIKPVKAAEFIYIPIRVVSTGAAI